jgi:hypothetical protein
MPFVERLWDKLIGLGFGTRCFEPVGLGLKAKK